MKVLKSVQELRDFQDSINKDLQVGFVPTMGALHDGHMALVAKAKEQNDLCVVSVFLNPKQFNSSDDLEKYPTNNKADIEKLNAAAVDVVFLPNADEIYADGYNYQVSEEELSPRFCGAHRPGHFAGVLTVVLKLLNLVQPQKAYFGRKDYQQFLLVKKMVDAFFLPVEIVGLDTIRESSGLAMSSRNMRLSEGSRIKAAGFYQAIKNSKTAEMAVEALKKEGFQVDYIEDFDGRRLAAVEIDNIRLIDNVEI